MMILKEQEKEDEEARRQPPGGLIVWIDYSRRILFAEMTSEFVAADGVAPQLTKHDAVAYLKAVKDTFKDDQDKYNEFLKAVKDSNAKRIDTAGLVSRVEELLKGHRALLIVFSAFVPEGYEIVICGKEKGLRRMRLGFAKEGELDKAVNYVSKVQARFESDPHSYHAFLETLSLYQRGNKSVQEVYEEVTHVLGGHADLVEDLAYFFPHSIIAGAAVENYLNKLGYYPTIVGSAAV